MEHGSQGSVHAGVVERFASRNPKARISLRGLHSDNFTPEYLMLRSHASPLICTRCADVIVEELHST